MRILHYSLGLPPYRTGGMTKFCTDLMISQHKAGHTVALLWPGAFSFFINKNVKIKKRGDWKGIINFELINPLPIPLDEGIKNIDAYTKPVNIDFYKSFLKKFKPDVIHIHTLMGLHKEFILMSNELGIRLVFTTHDYFGICPRVTLFRDGSTCDYDSNCNKCVECNEFALPLAKIAIMQSSLYRRLKDFYLVKFLRKKHRNNFFENGNPGNNKRNETSRIISGKDYSTLRKYYISILENIDFIHFNSTVAQKVYLKYIQPRDSKVISISHKDILDHRKDTDWVPNSEKLRITYLAATKPFKGYFILKKALDELWNEGNKSFELNIYCPINTVSEYMNVYPKGFNQSDLKMIFDRTDVLVAPSIWYETFGFTVLEALSYGCPVIVSENVGAKDIIGHGGMLVKAGDFNSLKNLLCSLTLNNILEMRKEVSNLTLINWNTFLLEIESIYFNK